MKQFIQNNFAVYSATCMAGCLVAGYMGLNMMQDKHSQQPAIQSSLEQEKHGSRVKSREELRLEAMVDNALKSSWKENLDNAYSAQERFMLPGRKHGGDPAFLQKIDQRCDDLLKKQQRKLRRKQKQKQQDFFEEQDDDDDDDEEEETNKIRFWK